ncbi:MAG TPA: HD domain-containing phosphohydrolase [Candidatus Limnocylindria bacterium]
MRDLRAGLRAYVLGVPAAAVVAVLAGAAIAPESDLRPGLAALVFALATLALREPIHLTRRTKLTLEDAITFAGALVLPPAVAMVVAGASTVAGLRFRTGTPWYDRAFNGGKTALAIGAAAATYHLLAIAPADSIDPAAAAVAAGAKYLTGVTLVDVAAGLQLHRSPFASWWQRRKTAILPMTALHLFGILGAVAALRQPWVLVLLIVPTASMLVLLREGRRARERASALLFELADLADLRDPYAHGHSRAAADVAERIAQRLHLPPDQTALVRDAARLQDIGLLDLVPSSVAIDISGARRHPDLGRQRLAQVPELWEHAGLIGMHHERPDGTGYPRGLRGEQVPIEASIVGIADWYVGARSPRPDSAALDDAEIERELIDGRGTRWHTSVVDGLLALLAEERVRVARPGTSAAIA